MRLTPPKNVTWWVAVILGVLGLLGHFGTIAVLSPYAFWFVVAGLVLLVVACLVRNL
jgi:4-hydroxybenzoate polyprenyltransferase